MQIENKLPLVSVIIPCFNAESTMSATINSVLEQTYENTEIIVVDDGSTDNTALVAQSFNHKIVFISKENGGPASARNVGIVNSSGDYISFLDSDDLWYGDKLKKQIEVLNVNDSLSMLFSGVSRIYDNGKREEKRVLDYDQNTKIDYYRIWNSNEITTSSVIFKKSIIQQIGLFDEDKLIQGAEDLDLWLRIADKFKIGYIDESLGIYRVSNSGHNRSNLERTFNALKVLFRKHEIVARGRGVSDREFKNRFYWLDKTCGIRLFRTGDVVSARHHLNAALKFNIIDFSVWFYFVLTFFPTSFLVKVRNVKSMLR